MSRRDDPSLPLRDVVVIGASAGGVAALRSIASALPAQFPAAVLMVLHTGAYPSRLPQILAAVGPNPADFAVDGESLRPGRIVVAPPDRHLLIQDGTVAVTHGPKEHHSRPAIDPLFRSAALWGGPRIVGVVLSGRNDDGTAGLQAVKSCGGVAIVQDPDDAEEPIMPRSALLHVEVDHVVPLANLVPTLVQLVGRPVGATPPVPERLVLEHAASLSEDDPMDKLYAIGKPSPLVCPDCNGTLFELTGTDPPRFRCHTGHAFSIRSLKQSQAEATEVALWTAIRSLQERERLLRKVSELDRIAGDAHHADQADMEAQRLADHVGVLRQLIDEV
ncbi:MAG TPA: chemotaxis protein CheB [Albitalea sp.]|uniref:chemotaxis protein CheB n=1 Tax=Piscinibacter sp. TaxID=1903157 RepID=UPI002ED1D4F6